MDEEGKPPPGFRATMSSSIPRKRPRLFEPSDEDSGLVSQPPTNGTDMTRELGERGLNLTTDPEIDEPDDNGNAPRKRHRAIGKSESDPCRSSQLYLDDDEAEVLLNRSIPKDSTPKRLLRGLLKDMQNHSAAWPFLQGPHLPINGINLDAMDAGRRRSASSPFARPTVLDSPNPLIGIPLSSPPSMSPPDGSSHMWSPGRRSMTATSVSSATEDSDVPAVKREKKKPSKSRIIKAPVNREEVPDYYEVIKEPMDLSTMESMLEHNLYLEPAEFLRDAKLIFDNCRKYNNETTPYAKNANKLEKFLWEKIKNMPPAWQVCIPTQLLQQPSSLLA
jgi:hypothetical protein